MKLIPFNFEAHPVRAAEIDGDPWFVAKDVCEALGLADVGVATRKLDPEEKGACSIRTPGGDQQMIIISESGLYALALRCRDAMTPGSVPHRFRKWVTADVLPTIRKTGGYGQASLDEERIATIAGRVCRETFREMLREVLPELMKAQLANGASNVRGWFLAIQVADNHGVPSRGRGKLVQRISCRLKEFCGTRGWRMEPEYREDGKRSRRKFSGEAISAWLHFEGLAMIAAHLANQPFARRAPEGQGVLPFMVPKRLG